MSEIAMVEIPAAGLGPYPAVVAADGGVRFNLHTVRRICRDSQAPLGQLDHLPGEGEYARLVERGEQAWLEFFRLADGPAGEQCEPVWAAKAGPDGLFPVPGDRWPWEVVTGSRGQVWHCCVSPFGPECGHQARPEGDDDHQECVKCGDCVYTLSSRFWCDGCEEEADQAANANREG